MITLRIEHPVTDLAIWRSAFDSFADVRRDAGVRNHRISRPLDHDHDHDHDHDQMIELVIDLDFDDAVAARAFLGFLTTRVWADPSNSPGLGGTPRTVLLEPAG